MQENLFDADGSYLLSVPHPHPDDYELIGDILRFGADLQVLAQSALRSKVQKGFLEATAKYV
jgi:predicted DNA-binding transcriptional regulator YafY